MVSTSPWRLKLRVERRGRHALDGADQMTDAFECEELALERHQHRVGGYQGIQGEQAEAGRAIDQDEVVWQAIGLVAGEGPRATGTRGGRR